MTFFFLHLVKTTAATGNSTHARFLSLTVVVPFSCFFVFRRYTVLFIHDGSSWRDVRVLEAAVRELHGVTSLSAAADLDIGDFSLK